MSDITISNDSQQAISLFISVGIPALVLLVFAILSLVGLTEFAARARAVPSKIRKYMDDKNDPLIVATLALYKLATKKNADPEIILAGIKAVLDSVEKPAQEVNIAAAPITPELKAVMAERFAK
jgi:hypothetical protein